MTTEPTVEEDGQLAPALEAFHNAIADLINETHQLAGQPDCPACQTEKCLGHPTPVQGLYRQLFDAVQAGRTGGSQSGGRLGTGSPIWTDALDLLDEIDTAAALWQPGYQAVPPTEARLQQQANRNWRPQDVHGLQQKTQALQAWKHDITKLFNPPRNWTIAAPCPNCDTATVHRRDNTGEYVRQPALCVDTTQCQCLNCRTVWQPYQFHILAEALQCPLPDGVLE